MRHIPRIARLAALAVAVRGAAAQSRPEALWYATGGEESVQSFLAHADRISIVSPQTYVVDSSGTVSGYIDRRLVDAARAKGVKVVPLVMNPGFDQPTMHRILVHPDARRRAIRSITALCRENGFDGIQFDFENIHIGDKDAFTSFTRETADSLHAAHCTLSAAIVPRTGDLAGQTPYHAWIFDNWRGAYDLKALAESLDFISYMTYAQHTGGSTPGPVAGYAWMERALKFALAQGVPPQKLSLGLASYSDWWYPAYDAKLGPRTTGRDVSYGTAMGVLARSGITPTWDERQKSYFALWDEDGVFQYVFIEDARSFEAKLALVKQYGLRGYSVWVLGSEDPAVWNRK
ncbi:MAG: glycosyl hydrolase [Gemmatimonadetes bacterium]|nr:glycosyl hydrolase [Gemmatimonadota bacterium]